MTTDLGSILSDLCECKVSSTGRPDGSLVLAFSLRNGAEFKRVVDRSLTLEEIVRLIRLDLFSGKGALSCRTAIQPCCTDALPTYSKKPLLETRGSQLRANRAPDKIN
jgi:hypothetical protein